MIRDMNQAERRAVMRAASITAITIGTANDANTFRKQVAAGALAAFAEEAKGLMLEALSNESHCSDVDRNSAPSFAADA